jgi:2-methylcitrate dehydratase PrpD
MVLVSSFVGAAGKRTEQVAAFIASATTTPLPPETVTLASLHLLDTLAAIVACRDLDASVAARRFVSRWSATDGDDRSATILGTSSRAALPDAVFAGAVTAHAAEINDFIPSVFVQPGPSVVAAALGVGEVRGASGTELIRAIAVGYELAARIPRALGVGNLRRAGIANHGVGSCFGAAAAASALLGLDREQVAAVLSLTAQQASGSWLWLLDVEHLEKAFVFGGMGARNGVHAALLVDAGFRGVRDVLDRDGTWFTARPFARPDGDGDLDALVDPRSTALVDTAFKRHPVGGPAQPAVEALLDLATTLRADEVADVLIEMPGRADAFRDAAMPALNLRYLAAVILLDGHLDFVAAQSLDRMARDAAVNELMARVRVRHDPSQEAARGEPRTESARVTLELRDGSSTARFVPHVLGFPSHPMAASDVEDKARRLVRPHLGDRRAVQLIEACRAVDGVDARSLANLIERGD